MPIVNKSSQARSKPCSACEQAFTSLASDLDMSLPELRAAVAMNKALLDWHVSNMKLETPEKFLQEQSIPILLGQQRSLRAEAAPTAESRQVSKCGRAMGDNHAHHCSRWCSSRHISSVVSQCHKNHSQPTDSDY
jgi:hypothetical protein